MPSDTNPAMRATAAPKPPVRPAPSQPRDSRLVEGDGFVIAAPATFQRAERTSSNGEPMLLLQHASKVAQVPARVAVLREPDPEQDVVEQSYVLEVTKRTLNGVTDISRSELDWPGSLRTTLVQWTENAPTTQGSSVPVRYWQLNCQVSRRLILVVVGFAPEAEFDTSGVPDVFSTFRPT